MKLEKLVELTLRRAPYVIFSKTAPKTLPHFESHFDFPNFFFNDAYQHVSGDSVVHMIGRNARKDHPMSFEDRFLDDVAVCSCFEHPHVKVVVEGWKAPAVRTVVDSRRTAMAHDGHQYILGCLSLIDEIELGVTTFRASPLAAAPLPALAHINPGWYSSAFDQLPVATWLINLDNGQPILENDLAQGHGPESHVWRSITSSAIDELLYRVREQPFRECYQLLTSMGESVTAGSTSGGSGVALTGGGGDAEQLMWTSAAGIIADEEASKKKARAEAIRGQALRVWAWVPESRVPVMAVSARARQALPLGAVKAHLFDHRFVI